MRYPGFLLAILGLLIGGCQATLLRGVAVVSGSEPAEQRGDRFKTQPDLALDRYEPADAPRACLVFFYGGSWRSGQRDWYRFVGRAFADRGYRVLIPDYRKAPAVQFPAFMEDAAAAVGFALARHCRDAGARPLPVFVAGHSAGAHIALLLATDARYLAGVGLRPQQLAGAIGLAGPYDFLPMTAADVIAVFGGNPTLVDSQPIHFADGDEPPLLLLHGGRDRVVAPRNSLNLAAAARAHGIPADAVIYPEFGHVGLLLALRPGHERPVLDDISRFVDQISRPPGDASVGR